MKLTVRHLQTPIRHQYDRPTCVAFAVTAFHEYVRDCSKSGKQIPDLDLSEEFLFHHCKQLDRLPTTKSGTTLEAAAAALRHAGQALEILLSLPDWHSEQESSGADPRNHRGCQDPNAFRHS